jgi:hypothetical protein
LNFTGGVAVFDFEVSDPAVVSDFDTLKLILGVPPPLEDYLPIERDLAAYAVKVHFASHVTRTAMERRLLTLVGISDFWFQFLGPPSEAEFRFRF